MLPKTKGFGSYLYHFSHHKHCTAEDQ
jgi:hypothetical protein